ncbi:MAG: hypothetical protein ISR65_05915 [Bacteriovoracaceae bacterium]|nr:hypothetical protein [Bacteriovoracaceae bacterium]
MKKAGVHIAGGGDAKYLSTVFLLTPHGLHSTFLLQILYSTILVGLLMIVNNTIKNFHEIVSLIRGNNWRLVGQFYGKKFSYAPVILLAWMGIGWLYKNTMY